MLRLRLPPQPRLFASCKLTANDSVTVALTGEYECWLLNDADESVQLAACELFGFGLGSFNEIGASNGLRPTEWSRCSMSMVSPVWISN